MTDWKDIKTPDFIGAVGLRPKKPTVDPKYASFNRRMMAATLDSLAAMVTVGPVVDFIFWRTHSRVPVDWGWLRQEMSGLDEQSAGRLYWQTLYETGFLAQQVDILIWQMMGLAIATLLCWLKWSATPGKMIMRIKIVDSESERPMTSRQAWLRMVGYLVSSAALFIGFFAIAWNKRRQGWHDKIAHTTVVVIPWRKKEESGI